MQLKNSGLLHETRLHGLHLHLVQKLQQLDGTPHHFSEQVCPSQLGVNRRPLKETQGGKTHAQVHGYAGVQRGARNYVRDASHLHADQNQASKPF